MASNQIASRRPAKAKRHSPHPKKNPQEIKQPAASELLPPQHGPIRRSEKASPSTSYYEDKDFGSVWLSEFLSYEKARNEAIAKADLMNFTELPGSTVHPHAEKHLVQQSKSAKKQPQKGGSLSSMSHDERRRLTELSKQLNKKVKAESQMTKGHTQKLTPYVEANTKISRVLQHVKLKANKEDMEASQLNNFYKLVARETQAAIRLQSQCRRVLATKYATQFALEVRRATQIQSCVRMLLAKNRLEELKARERWAMKVRERFIQWYIARYRRRKLIEFENSAALVCQSAVRMYFSKCILNEKRLQYTWEVNQQRWNAVSIRLAWKDLRINFYARQIQCIVRRKLEKTRVQKLFHLYTSSAVSIQCIWRRFAARLQKAEIIYKATVETMCNKIRLIASEKEYWKQQLDDLGKLKRLQHQKDLQAQAQQLDKERAEKEEQIHLLEAHYKDQLDLKNQISPRAIAGGWEEQINISLKDTRERITGAKLDLLFRIQILQKKVASELKLMQAAADDARQSFDHWSDWYQIEQDRLWQFQRQHNRAVEGKELRHSIISEQLKWEVRHCVACGKPDKRRPLVYGPKETDDRVQQMIDAVKEKADEFQAAAHVEHTFQPFQRMMDTLGMKLNELDSADRNRVTQMNNARCEDGMAQQKIRPSSRRMGHDQMDLDDQEQSFPTKLPWKLLEKVRDERRDITTTLKPK